MARKSDPLPPWEKPGPPRGLQRFVPKLGKKPPEGEIARAKAQVWNPEDGWPLPPATQIIIPLTDEERRQRREDNRRMREIHSKVRRRKPHGRH